MTTVTDGVNYMLEKIEDIGNNDTTESFWDSGIVITEDEQAQPINVYINNIAITKINMLMEHYTNIEWLAYTIGYESENGDRFINDIIIPKQNVTAVRVDVLEPVNQSTMGVIHSHHGMMNKFSHTDDEFINTNNNLSLCIARNGISGVVRIKKSDDEYTLVKANVIIDTFGINKEKFLKKAISLINEVSYNDIETTVISGNGYPSFTNNSFTGVINECRDFVVECIDNDDESYLNDFVNLKNLIDIYMVDDGNDEYIKAIQYFYDKEEEISCEILEFVDFIDIIFYKDTSAIEKVSLKNLLILLENIG
jgi:hypothetical protein